jgi:site-specific recombinase XerD
VATEVEPLVASCAGACRPRNLGKRTVEPYTDSATQLADWLAERDVTQIAAVTREHVSAFITHLIELRSPSTASVRYRALRQLFHLLVDEDEIESSPMAKTKPPARARVRRAGPDRRPAPGAAGHLQGKEFHDGRDQAMISLFHRHGAPARGTDPAGVADV